MTRTFFRTLTFYLVLSASAVAAEDFVMMKIGNANITASEVKEHWQRLFPEGQAPELDMVQPALRQNFLRSIMVERVLEEEAKKSGIAEEPQVKRALAEARRTVLVREFLAKKSAAATSDTTLRSAYGRMVAARKNQNELRLRHILVHSEEEARSVRDQLVAGGDFNDLAQKFSKDPATAEEGGDLGYMLASDMDKTFSEAAFALKKHAISAPVKTQMGWHIIRVDESRKASIPTFAQAREGLHDQLQEQALNSYVEQLIKQAGIVVMDESGAETRALSKPSPAAKNVLKPLPVEKKSVVSTSKPVSKSAAKPAPKPTPKPVQPPESAPFKQQEGASKKSATNESDTEKPEAKPAVKFDPNDPKTIPKNLQR